MVTEKQITADQISARISTLVKESSPFACSLIRALGVILLDVRHRDYLLRVDPKAYAQACRALGLMGGQ
jgi:hypothetical protein